MTIMKNNNFKGKVAFVTGAASGIGRATAIAFALEGASVIVADISDKGTHETTRMIKEAGGQALAVKCDVSQTDSVRNCLGQAIDTFGRLDFAFNNAGVEQKLALTAELPIEEWDRVINTDLRSVFLCLKHEIPLMLKQGGGAIVNTSSVQGSKDSGRRQHMWLQSTEWWG
jgi:NAD(P)-dependent dehydrogenase (short-subunit alcohol dehydrogenase family)